MIPRFVIKRLEAWEPRFSPRLFRGILIAFPIAAFVVPLLLVAVPYLDIFNDMAVQPKGKAQSFHGHAFGQELLVERPPVEGTLPTGWSPYSIPGKDEAATRKAEETLVNPLSPTMAVLERGKAKWEAFCIVCHGEMGEGDGSIVGPGLFAAPPTLHTDATRAFKDGRIFHVITNGQNVMPSYADKLTEPDRWAVVHYVRALQRAMAPRPEDLER